MDNHLNMKLREFQELHRLRNHGWMSRHELNTLVKSMGVGRWNLRAHLAHGSIDACCTDRHHWLYRVVSKEMVLACEVEQRLNGEWREIQR